MNPFNHSGDGSSMPHLPPFQISQFPAFRHASEELFEPSLFDYNPYLELEQNMQSSQMGNDSSSNEGSLLAQQMPSSYPSTAPSGAASGISALSSPTSAHSLQSIYQIIDMDDMGSLSAYGEPYSYGEFSNEEAHHGGVGNQEPQNDGILNQSHHTVDPANLYQSSAQDQALDEDFSWMLNEFDASNEQGFHSFDSTQNQGGEVPNPLLASSHHVSNEHVENQQTPASSVTGSHHTTNDESSEHSTGLTAQSTAQSTAQPIAQPATHPAAHPAAQPAAQPTHDQPKTVSINDGIPPRKKRTLPQISAAAQSKSGPTTKAKSLPRQNTAASRIAKPRVKKSSSEKLKFTRRAQSKFSEIQDVMEKLQAAADQLNARDDIEPADYPHPPYTNGLYFTSAQAAAAVNMITYWEPPTDDDTIPTTQAEREAWVIRLMASIKNNRGCLKTNEQKDSQSFLRRWADGATFFPATAVEAVAWKILQLAIDVHRQGWANPIPEPKLREDIYYSMLFSFEDRMKFIETVLQLSKSTCEDLIKGNRLDEIVGCPHVVFERIHGNNKSNKDKSGKLGTLTGHTIKKEITSPTIKKEEGSPKRKYADWETEDEDAEDESGKAPLNSERPRKRQKKTVVSASIDSNAAVEADASPRGAAYAVNDILDPQSMTQAEPLPTEPAALLKAMAKASKTDPKVMRTKRRIDDIDGDVAESASPAKKTRSRSHAKVPLEGKSHAKRRTRSAAAQSDSEAQLAAPDHRRKAVGKPASRTSTRNKTFATSSDMSAYLSEED
ncbi:hypothetical protein OPT61_g381 [Boeremia exigua]|uniref:Uncharacterized protein n=1 Tax=Boeremia exigua TaxID=749465 RepID=A0ACC2IU64_9PLEO|nr:hypothetical protein OPT61_g381 [Boeremia exigua]